MVKLQPFRPMHAHQLYRVLVVAGLQRDCAVRLAKILQIFEKLSRLSGSSESLAFPPAGEFEDSLQSRTLRKVEHTNDRQERGMGLVPSGLVSGLLYSF